MRRIKMLMATTMLLAAPWAIHAQTVHLKGTLLPAQPTRQENSAKDEARKRLEEIKKRDRAMFDAAYVLPLDSIEVAEKPYDRSMGINRQLYSIEIREDDTKVTFLQPIYFDSQWIYYSKGFQIRDRKSGDIYHVRGYDGGAPMDRLLIVRGFNGRYIKISLLFPKLKKGVKRIDLIETPHKNDANLTPSNSVSTINAFYNIKVKKYLVSGKKQRKEYF